MGGNCFLRLRSLYSHVRSLKKFELRFFGHPCRMPSEWQFLNMCGLLAVGGGVGGDFAGEGAVDVDEVDGCEDHADEPPGEADLQAVVGGFSVVDG